MHFGPSLSCRFTSRHLFPESTQAHGVVHPAATRILFDIARECISPHVDPLDRTKASRPRHGTVYYEMGSTTYLHNVQPETTVVRRGSNVSHDAVYHHLTDQMIGFSMANVVARTDWPVQRQRLLDKILASASDWTMAQRGPTLYHAGLG